MQEFAQRVFQRSVGRDAMQSRAALDGDRLQFCEMGVQLFQIPGARLSRVHEDIAARFEVAKQRRFLEIE